MPAYSSKKFRLAAAMASAAMIAALVTACGGNASSSPSEDNPYGLIQPGTVRVASVGDLKPYAFADAQGNTSLVSMLSFSRT